MSSPIENVTLEEQRAVAILLFSDGWKTTREKWYEPWEPLFSVGGLI